MSTSTSALRIEQLKTELRREEAALNAKKTLASELNEARAAEAEASRLERLNATNIAQATEGLELLRSERDTTPYQFVELRAKKDNEFKIAQDNLLRLQAEAPELAKKLAEKRSARAALEERIAAHPIYKSVRERQGELVEQAAKLVESLFETTLTQWPRVMDLISRTERAEDSLILASIPELSAVGLPEIGRVLNGFFQQAVPHAIFSAIPHERTRAFQEIARVRALALRGMVR
jgi:cell fate (sporulation/competence/biofilm development) regulator YmcA (YheA/YmcA/DUF963 family)